MLPQDQLAPHMQHMHHSTVSYAVLAFALVCQMASLSTHKEAERDPSPLAFMAPGIL